MLDQNAPLLRFTLLSELLPAPEVLAHDPIGWEDMGFSLHRDPKYHGLTTEYTVELGFVKRGQQVLSQLVERAGPEAQVELLVEAYDANTFTFETYYRGQLDLSGSSQTATEFRAAAEKTGFTQRFLSREDAPVDLFGTESVSGYALPAHAPVVVELHSKAIRQRYEARVVTAQPPPFANYVTDGESRFQWLYFGFGSLASIDEFAIQETESGAVTIATGSGPLSQIPVYTAKESGLFRIDFSLFAELEITRQDGRGDFDSVDADVLFRINDEQPVTLFSSRDKNIGVDSYKKQLAGAYKLARELQPGDKIYLYGYLHVYDITSPAIGPYSFPVTVQLKPGAYFTMEADTQTAPTPAAGLLAYEALERLAQALTDSPQALRSDFFGRPDTAAAAYAADGPGALTMLTGGFQVRGFPLAEKSLFATWKDVLDSLSAAYFLGVGIESDLLGRQTVRVESATYFYQEQVVLDLGVVAGFLPDGDGTMVSNLKLKELPDRTYKAAKVGWQKWQTGQLNGLDEFNAPRQWSLPLAQPPASYEAVGGYITAGFYLESTRRQRYDATATTDDRADNENFLICLARPPASDTAGGFATERDEAYAQVSGVFSPATAYNLRLSPARMLRRHGPALAAGLRLAAGQRLRFAFGEGNNALLTRLPGQPVVLESGDVPVEQLGPPLWRAQAWEFTAPCRRAQADAVRANPYGRVRFTDERGQRQEGWLLDFKHSLVGREADFVLLRCHTLSSLS